MELTLAAARALALAAQGLHAPPERAAEKADVLAAIRRMAALQIDSISVVARSPYLVLWSRLGPYPPHWLDELLAEGAIFEYWSHAACFLPIEDYGLYRRAMLDGWPHSREWIAGHQEEVATILERIKTSGPVRSADFPRTDGRVGTWWNWKPEKEILERLFALGVLMVARREGFQRIYDLQERVVPHWNDADAPPAAATRRAFALKAVRALGVARASWVPAYFDRAKRDSVPLLAELVREEQLLPVRVIGWEQPAFIHPDHRLLAEQASAGLLHPTRTTLLSPFDPLIWDRARLLELFGFAYRIETYTPEAQRRYGYFTLPILHRGALVGRLDPKAHRRDGVFEIRALHLEPGVTIGDELVTDLAATLRDCAQWHQTPEVTIRQSDPAELAPLLRAALQHTG